MDKYKFGEFIYQKRKKAGLTQDELGRRLGVTNKAVSKWETGETMPEVSMLEALASILNVTVDELLKQKDNNEVNIKNTKINKFMFVSIIVLLLALILTILFFTLRPKNEVVVNQDNYSEYIIINPLDSFDIENQKLKLTSSFLLNKECIVKEKITLTISYKINFYYYKEDNTIGVMTYYNRLSTIEILNNELVLSEISLEPKEEISLYKGLKKIEVEYGVNECKGVIEYE